MKGLTSSQAEKLLEKYGLNVLEEGKKESFIQRLFGQFNNFLTLLLILAAGFSFFIGEAVDGGLIMAIVVLNGLFGYYQESKAEEAIASLKKLTVSKVRVVRDGREREIDSRYLVPGDAVFIEEGAKIPADGILLESRNLEVNEAGLTGESLPVPKMAKEKVFMGTIVAKGRGYLQVEGTGQRTKFGEIATHLSEISEGKTPLQRKLEGLTRFIGIMGIAGAVIVFLLSTLRGENYFPAFLLAISLAVAVVPEGLPAVMTITLAIGTKEMSRRKAIVRKLGAIEALGSVTLIATDKTGTLTANKMKVSELYIENKIFTAKNLPRISNRAFSMLALNGILNSTASLVPVHDHGSFDVLGDPTEGALLYLGQEAGLIPDMIRQQWQVVDEEPFDSVTKRMSVMVRDTGHHQDMGNVHNMVLIKGAPESVLPLCTKYMSGHASHNFDEEKTAAVQNAVREWGQRGLRVLALAYKNVSNKNTGFENLTEEAKKEPVVFLGMVAIHDAPRLESAAAVGRARKAGIKVVMITGDNEKTAEAIATHTGIMEEGAEVLTGQQLEEYSDSELLKILPNVRVFARTTPVHKYRIVKLFQEMGEVVAVTGDGVNDAIALKQADVGVAMGLAGTDVAKETADMIITDDNFATIVNAVEEGRNIIKNLKNAITYLLSCNLSEAIALIIGLVLGLPHIFYPLQFLYINLVTDGLPAICLAFSPRSRKIMERPPQKELSLLASWEKKYIFMTGTIAAVLVLTAFYFYKNLFGVEVGKTAAFTVLTLSQSFILVDIWLTHRSLVGHVKHLFSGIFLPVFLFPFVLQMVIVGLPKSAGIFGVAAVSPFLFLQFVLVAAIILPVVNNLKAKR